MIFKNIPYPVQHTKAKRPMWSEHYIIIFNTKYTRRTIRNVFNKREKLNVTHQLG